ncbi:MAG: ecotin family protein [Planctomycetales bacterium]|nr:ecotin family protein [Planctomycetales bacterium]
MSRTRMQWLLVAGVVAALVGQVSMASAQSPDYLKAFPAAAEGMKRLVIQLPHKERGEDEGFRVELFAGKEMLTDGVNRVRLGGQLEAKPLKGWGFTYYEVAKFGPAMSTRIGVPPGTPQVKQFVAIPSITIPYNSRVPLVVYVPADGAVQYRIWTAGEQVQVAPEG